MVRAAFSASGTSTAPGPDGLTILHLRNLGPSGISCRAPFTISLNKADIPATWKSATISAIPKPGKPASNSSSYRLISLLSPLAKVLERLILPFLQDHLPLSDTQHGFREQRTTTSALLPLIQTIATGFNQMRPPNRTVLMTTDFSKALDTVPHEDLLSQLASSSLPHNVIRWLSGYLKDRQARCTYEGTVSPYKAVRAEVPQGSIISPVLFNFFCGKLPLLSSPDPLLRR